MFAHVVRYEVGRQENAAEFVDEVMAEFDRMQSELPGIGSLLLTRRDDGEALQIVLFDTEEDANAAEPLLQGLRAPDTGAREVVTGRRPDQIGGALWKAWQGRWNLRTDQSSTPATG